MIFAFGKNKVIFHVKNLKMHKPTQMEELSPFQSVAASAVSSVYQGLIITSPRNGHICHRVRDRKN